MKDIRDNGDPPEPAWPIIHPILSNKANRLRHYKIVRMWTEHELPLPQLVDAYKGSRCERIIDKIYGLVGLVNGTAIDVDYNRPLPDILVEMLELV